MAQSYNQPGVTPSTIGSQINTFFYQKQALMEIAKTQYFSQLADVTQMPKNFGKTIKRNIYIPLLDVQNNSDQGIDAAGVTIDSGYHKAFIPSLVLQVLNAGKVAAEAALEASGLAVAVGADGSGALAGCATLTITLGTAATVAASKGASPAPTASNYGLNLYGVYSTAQKATLSAIALLLNDVGGTPAVITYEQLAGNLYGSSKDIGTVSGKLPLVGENGGRVNRVGFVRKEITGTFAKFGFFYEWTKESLDFDTDAELQSHLTRESLNGASEMTEDALQIDLLNAAGTVKFAGNATSNITMNAGDLISYSDIMRLGIDLDNNRTPKNTNVISGSRMVDTRTLTMSRVAFVGSELIPTIRAMVDLHGAPAFIEAHKYAGQTQLMNGEIGTIDCFRIIVVPEMLKWSGAGADAADPLYYSTGMNYDIFPFLVIGDGSFTTIGFQTDGKSVKFVTITKMPGAETADKTDPFGETGFTSIKWYYGFMALRPERIGLIKTLAKM